MEELGRRFDAAAPETAVVVTPHNVHVEGHFAVVTAGRVGETSTDRGLARVVARRAPRRRHPRARRLLRRQRPAARREMPVDWGTSGPAVVHGGGPVVVVSPARDRPLAEHVRAGAAIARAAGDRRVALIASADHGHAHDADGPYGFDPAAAAYDAQVQDVLGSGRLDFEPLGALVADAKADSLWQLLVLQGAVGAEAEVDLLAYAAPTYFGMLCAEVRP